MVKVRIIADIVSAVSKGVFKLTGFGECGDKSVQFNIDCLKIAAIKKKRRYVWFFPDNRKTMHLVHIFGYVKYWGHCEFFVSYHLVEVFVWQPLFPSLCNRSLGNMVTRMPFGDF